MSILTDFMERKLLDHIFGVTEMTKLTSLYLGISTTAFTESDTASQALAKEVGTSGTTYNNNGYQRVSVYSTSTSDGLRYTSMTTSPNVENKSQISFPQATTSNWGSIGYWALFEDQIPTNGTSSSTVDADDGQKPLMIGSFSTAVTVNVGDQFRIATGAFTIEFPDKISVIGTSSSSTSLPYHSKYGLMHLLGLSGSVNHEWDFYDGSADFYSIWMGISTSAFGTSGVNDEADSGRQEPGFTTSINATSVSAYRQNGYNERPKITFNSASTSNGVTTITNSNVVEFPECETNNWGDITHFAFFAGGTNSSYFAKDISGSSVTSGDANQMKKPFFIGALDAAKTVNVGDTLRFPAGSISIALD